MSLKTVGKPPDRFVDPPPHEPRVSGDLPLKCPSMNVSPVTLQMSNHGLAPFCQGVYIFLVHKSCQDRDSNLVMTLAKKRAQGSRQEESHNLVTISGLGKCLFDP